MSCRTGNFPERVCALETQYSQLINSVGHPALVVTNSGSTFQWNQQTQTLVIPLTGSTTNSVDTVRWADDAARAALAPLSLNQIGIQATDATNGNYSLWVATGLSAGNWVLKAGSMASQQSSSVIITGGSISGITDLAIADGGTGASDKIGARTNLTLSSLTPAANVIDWSLSDNYYAAITAATTFTFLNKMNGKTVRLAAAMSGNFALTFPTVKWAGGNQTVHSNLNTDLYEFHQINGVVYGTITKGFA